MYNVTAAPVLALDLLHVHMIVSHLLQEQGEPAAGRAHHAGLPERHPLPQDEGGALLACRGHWLHCSGVRLTAVIKCFSSNI